MWKYALHTEEVTLHMSFYDLLWGTHTISPALFPFPCYLFVTTKGILVKLTNIITSLPPISLQVGFCFCCVENAVLNIFAFVKLFIYDNFLKRDCWIEYTFFKNNV